jgi:hypothetical protein
MISPRLAVAAVLAGCAGLVGAVPAQAANGTVGQRETVCADSLSVRTAPNGAWMGVLHHPQTFLVQEDHGSWVFGFAYGDINRNGWVQNGWFC